MKKIPKLSIVIPAYNEELRIMKTLNEFYNYFTKKYNTEIIVVCDGNTDRTPELVAKFAKTHRAVKLLTFPKRLGKGGGIIAGLKAARGDLIGFVDADSATLPADYNNLVEALLKNKIDGAIASRYLPESRILIKQPLYRKFLSRGWNFLVRILFQVPFTDTQCGAKVFRGTAIKKIIPRMQSIGFEFDVEVLWRLNREGFKVKEVPTTWAHQEYSKFRLSNVTGMLFRLLKVRFS